MKVKIFCKDENHKVYSEMMINGGFIISDDFDIFLKEVGYEEDYIQGKKDGFIERISIKDVYLIESFGHKVYVNTRDERYLVTQKLFELELKYESNGFIRVNQSQIISLKHINKMKPLINYKIKVVLCNESIIYVTRSYYHKFKNIMGF